MAIKDDGLPSGDDTPFVRSLIRAAAKQVACAIELGKRASTQPVNLLWAQELQKAGAHVKMV